MRFRFLFSDSLSCIPCEISRLSVKIPKPRFESYCLLAPSPENDTPRLYIDRRNLRSVRQEEFLSVQKRYHLQGIQTYPRLHGSLPAIVLPAFYVSYNENLRRKRKLKEIGNRI